MAIVNQKPEIMGGSNLPVRILHVIHRMRPGGAQALVMNIYRHLDRSQIQFDFAVRSNQSEYYDEEIESLGGRLFHLPWGNGNPLNVVAYTRGLEAVLREEGPFTGLHSHVSMFSGHVLPIGRKAGIKLRLVHGHSAAAEKVSLLRSAWSEVMRRRIRANATHFLACSPTAAEWLYGTQWQQNVRFWLFPNAIDLAPYASIHPDRHLWRLKTGLPIKGPLVGHIGRFDQVKNHTFLLEIFSTFRDFFPEAKLILVGEGDLKKHIEREAEAKGIAEAVCFLGVRSDIPQILGALDLFVLPSLHEGLGIVLVEAQAAGVPCLASDTVPKEVDLGLGLVRFESLDAGALAWAQALRALALRNGPAWEKRKAALQKAGYDIGGSVKFLQKLYLAAV